jgi:hypothetical protein
MRVPFSNLTPQERKRLFWFFLASALVLMFLLNLAGAPLTTPQAPYGIVSYELAGSVAQAQAMLDSWDHTTQLRAAFSLGLDYLFMPAYAGAISLACLWAAAVLRQRAWPLVALGAPLAWGQWLAALLDAIENLGLTVILFGAPVSPWPELAFWCAALKFILIFIGLVYALLGLIAATLVRISPKT